MLQECAFKRIFCTLTFGGSFQTVCFLLSQCVFRYTIICTQIMLCATGFITMLQSPKYRGVFKEKAISDSIEDLKDSF